ncbi:hypothetical protein BDF22DRAFT_655457 [Syncephalis plumigaleata]|nr:hypothetical protein BDF22DRAFT_655457 [Syncephalis plumigaleata]
MGFPPVKLVIIKVLNKRRDRGMTYSSILAILSTNGSSLACVVYCIYFAIVELSKSTGWAGWVSVLNYVPIFNALVFLCFAIWFAFNAYRLRRHVEGYHRFMQHGPKLNMKTRIATFTTSGMTTVDHVIKTHVYTTHHPAADGFVNRIT